MLSFDYEDFLFPSLTTIHEDAVQKKKTSASTLAGKMLVCALWNGCKFLQRPFLSITSWMWWSEHVCVIVYSWWYTGKAISEFWGEENMDAKDKIVCFIASLLMFSLLVNIVVHGSIVLYNCGRKQHKVVHAAHVLSIFLWETFHQ